MRSELQQLLLMDKLNNEVKRSGHGKQMLRAVFNEYQRGKLTQDHSVKERQSQVTVRTCSAYP